MTSFSLFTGLTPQGVGSDPNDYELATKFRSSEDGLITGLRYYRILEDSGDVDERTLTLWNISGAPLVSLTISSGVGDVGWQVGSLPIPIQITGGELYIVSYGYDDDGVDDAYAFTGSFFDSDYSAPGGFLLPLRVASPWGLVVGVSVMAFLQRRLVPSRSSHSMRTTILPMCLWVVCFLPGTLIATPKGEQKIETLQPGDQICTLNGVCPVKFICRASHNPVILWNIESLPICIKAGALGDALPSRDLYLSGGHAVFIDAHLFQASALVNGTTIIQTEPEDGKGAAHHLLQHRARQA